MEANVVSYLQLRDIQEALCCFFFGGGGCCKVRYALESSTLVEFGRVQLQCLAVGMQVSS